MDTVKLSSENAMPNQFSSFLAPGATLVDQSQQSFIQSFSETRNLMSQFTSVPPTSTHTVNLGEFQDLIGKSMGLKAPVITPISTHNGGNAITNNNYTSQANFLPGLIAPFPKVEGQVPVVSEPAKTEPTPKQGKVMSVSESHKHLPLLTTSNVNSSLSSVQSNQVTSNVLSQTKTENINTLIQNALLPPNTFVSHASIPPNILPPNPDTAYVILPKIEGMAPPLNDATVNINTMDTNTTCDVCGKVCKDVDKLKVHKLSHAKDKPFKCDVCGKGFITSVKLKAHINIHGGEPPHYCPVCNKAFHNKTYVDRHMVVHSTDKPHRCETCGKAFGRKEHLKRHALTHSGEKPHKCTLCAKSFRCKSNLITHVLKHSNPDYANTNDNNSNAPVKRRPRQQHHCTICNQIFSTKSQFNAHVLEHTGRKPYQCDKCDKCFNDKSSLCRHNMVHTGEKPYKCPRCEKSFARRDHLQRHTLTHTGEKPHQCRLCPRYFKLKRELNAHLAAHKENESGTPMVTDQPSNNALATPDSQAGHISDNAATPSSQVSTDQGAMTAAHQGQVSNPTPPLIPSQGGLPTQGVISITPLNVTPDMNAAPQQVLPGNNTKPPVLPNATLPQLAAVTSQGVPPIQVPIPHMPISSIAASLMQNLPQVGQQPGGGQGLMNQLPLNQLLSQINMLPGLNGAGGCGATPQLPAGVSSLPPTLANHPLASTLPQQPTTQMPLRPVPTLPATNGGAAGLNAASAMPFPVQNPATSLPLMSSFFGQQQTSVAPAVTATNDAYAQFALPAISSVMAPQNSIVTLGFPAGIKLPEYATVSTSSGSFAAAAAAAPIKAEPVSVSSATAFQPPKSTQNGGLVASGYAIAGVKSEHSQGNATFPPLIKPETNVLQLGMSLPVVPVATSSNDVYNATEVSQRYENTQKANTDGDIYGQVENVSQLNAGYGMVKEEGLENGLYGPEDGLANADHSSLITNAMNSLNTIANCQLSA